jgi:alkylated DNA repair dioxygenase AlkB
VQLSLDIAAAPDGLVYIPDFITVDEEVALLAAMALIDWQKVVMHGTAARRTVAHFGVTYGYSSWRLEDAPPLPPWAVPLLPRVAAAMREPPNALGELLASCYPEGARIGWHRDAPMFGPTVAGLSLVGACTLKMRRNRQGALDTYERELAPRSLYVLSGGARAQWQHMIPPVPSLRYSLTFRTLNRRA